MNPQQSSTPPLAVMQPGEKVLFNIKRHPVGLIIIYAICAFMILAIGIVFFVVLPSLFPGSNDEITAVGAIVFMIIAILITVFAFISSKVYWDNTWTLTGDSLTQVTRTGLFNKQSGQLSLESLEDVSAAKSGVLSHIFNYGTVKAETAGEHSKFIFTYCANPTDVAQQVLQAREAFAQGGGHEGAKQAEPPMQQPIG